MASTVVDIREDSNPGAERNVKIGLRGKGATPSVPTDWPGDAFPTWDLTFAIGEKLKQITITTKGNTKVDGNRNFELYPISMIPADATFKAATGKTLDGTILDDETSTAPTTTIVYGPKDNAADSGDIDFQSNRQLMGRTYRDAAPKWKGILGEINPAYRSNMNFIADDAAGSLVLFSVVDGATVKSETIAYDGAKPSATDSATKMVSDENGIRYMVGDRVLVSKPYSIWSDINWWGRAEAAARMPGKKGQANAHQATANGIFAARIGPVQA